MSRKRPKNSDLEPAPDDSSAPGNDLESEDSLEEAESEIVDESDSNVDNDEDDEDEEEEFSLDQLSQAYAEVLKGRNQDDARAENGDESDSNEEITATNETDEVDDEQPATDDNAGCPISPETIIESILFVGTPKDFKLNSRKIAAVLRDVSPKEVTKTVRELNRKYEKENAAYRIESDGGVFKMVLDPALVEFQQEFFGRNRQVRLNQSAIDVMAIVAYNQPVTREQVDKMRAKPSGSVLNQLVKRRLLFVEPGETNSKIKYFATTDRFLDLFQLEEIADLPQSHDVSDIAELAD